MMKLSPLNDKKKKFNYLANPDKTMDLVVPSDMSGYDSAIIHYAKQLKYQHENQGDDEQSNSQQKLTDAEYIEIAKRYYSINRMAYYVNRSSINITGSDKVPDSKWAQYSYEEILQMAMNGVKIPDEVLYWAKAQEEADITSYIVISDDAASDDNSSTEDITKNNDINSLRNNAKEAIVKAVKQQNILENKSDTVNDLTQKAAQLQKENQNLIGKAQENQTQKKVNRLIELRQKAEQEELTSSELNEYKNLQKELDRKGAIRKDIQQRNDELEAFLNSIDSLSRDCENSSKIVEEAVFAGEQLGKLDEQCNVEIRKTHDINSLRFITPDFLANAILNIPNSQIPELAIDKGKDLDEICDNSIKLTNDENVLDLIDYANSYIEQTGDIENAAETETKTEVEEQKPEATPLNNSADVDETQTNEETNNADNPENQEINNEEQNQEAVAENEETAENITAQQIYEQMLQQGYSQFEIAQAFNDFSTQEIENSNQENTLISPIYENNQRKMGKLETDIEKKLSEIKEIKDRLNSINDIRQVNEVKQLNSRLQSLGVEAQTELALTKSEFNNTTELTQNSMVISNQSVDIGGQTVKIGEELPNLNPLFVPLISKDIVINTGNNALNSGNELLSTANRIDTLTSENISKINSYQSDIFDNTGVKVTVINNEETENNNNSENIIITRSNDNNDLNEAEEANSQQIQDKGEDDASSKSGGKSLNYGVGILKSIEATAKSAFETEQLVQHKAELLIKNNSAKNKSENMKSVKKSINKISQKLSSGENINQADLELAKNLVGSANSVQNVVTDLEKNSNDFKAELPQQLNTSAITGIIGVSTQIVGAAEEQAGILMKIKAIPMIISPNPLTHAIGIVTDAAGTVLMEHGILEEAVGTIAATTGLIGTAANGAARLVPVTTDNTSKDLNNEIKEINKKAQEIGIQNENKKDVDPEFDSEEEKEEDKKELDEISVPSDNQQNEIVEIHEPTKPAANASLIASVSTFANIKPFTDDDTKAERRLTRFNHDSSISSRKRHKKVTAIAASTGGNIN